MLKKAKIVNLSLSSAQKPMSPVIHFYRQHSNQHSKTYSDQSMPHIVKDCIEVINLISTEKKRLAQKDRKASKIFNDASKGPKKMEKQSGIWLSSKVAQSVEVILRKFILFQVQEDQQKLSSNYARHKKIQQKTTKLYKTLLFRSNKQNADNSTLDQRTGEPQIPMFKTAPKMDKITDKFHNNIIFLQRQLKFCREKLAEKCNLIAKLQSRQCFLKKKHQNQVSTIARYKNILTINALFEKEIEQRQEGKYLMNVSGKNLELKRQNPVPHNYQLQRNGSSRMIAHKLQKKTIKTSPAEALLKSSSRKLNFLQSMQKNSTGKSSKSIESCNKKSSFTLKNELQSSKQASKISILKRELDELQQEKEQTIECLNDNASKLQKHIEDLESKIVQKQKEIGFEQQLLTDQQLNMLKQEDFQALQLTGFYGTTQNLPDSTFQ